MRKLLVILLILVFLSIILAPGLSATPTYHISRSVIGGAGQQATGTGLILNGTLGEPIASPLTMDTSNGLSSGFWQPWSGWDVYLPLVLKNASN